MAGAETGGGTTLPLGIRIGSPWHGVGPSPPKRRGSRGRTKPYRLGRARIWVSTRVNSPRHDLSGVVAIRGLSRAEMTRLVSLGMVNREKAVGSKPVDLS